LADAQEQLTETQEKMADKQEAIASQQRQTQNLIKSLMQQVRASKKATAKAVKRAASAAAKATAKAVKKAAKAASKKKVPFAIKKSRAALKAAQSAQISAEEKAFKAAQKLRKIKRLQSERLRKARSKCNGKCPREFPILVGPKNVPSKETRTVVVIGDKGHNRARWSKVHTPSKYLWNPKGLKKAKKHVLQAAARIIRAAKTRKRLSEAPLGNDPRLP